MYTSDFKGVIVFPEELDNNFSPNKVFWHQRLSIYMNKREVRSGNENTSQLSQVLRGCPEWEPIDNDGNGRPDSDKIGYGMSRRLRTPDYNTRYHKPTPECVALLSNNTVPWHMEDPNQTPYPAGPWKITQVRNASSRIIFGDSRNTWLDPTPDLPTVPASETPGWSLDETLIQATSGDIGRHSSVRFVRNKNDPKYKALRANYCFVDGHCETLDPDVAFRAISNPK
jgi:prepilin-type processing-associated H-X9-DG protein